MNKKFAALLFLVGLFAACAHQYRLIVNYQGKTRQKYELDLGQ
jgi:hypothetical protein